MRDNFDTGYGLHKGEFYPKSYGILKDKVGYEER